MNIPNTIIKQLGGYNRLKAMIGAHTFLYSEKDPTWISFKFKGSRFFNYIKIQLNSLDLYDVELKKIWGDKFTRETELNNLYNDQLKTTIEQETRLYLSL